MPKNWMIFSWKSSFCLDIPLYGIIYQVPIIPSKFQILFIQVAAIHIIPKAPQNSLISVPPYQW